MLKIFALSICSFLVAGDGKAQAAEDSVKLVINQLFTAMKESDSVLLTSCFTSSAILQTIQNKDGKQSIGNEAVADFAGLVAKQAKNDLDERIKFDIVRIDDNLAIAWTPYRFYFKGQFSHCGVNSFQLVRLDGQWKIQYLIDTRRKQRCE